MARWFLPALIALLALAAGRPAEAARPRSRAEFVRAFRTIERTIREKRIPPEATLDDEIRTVNLGMAKSRVRRLLGPPDDVILGSEGGPHGGSAIGVVDDGVHAWRYGTRSHLGFPTLGEVWFDGDDRAILVTGSLGKPISPQVLSEEHLREILTDLNALPDFGRIRSTDSPSLWVRTAHRLQSLGRERAVAVVEEFMRMNVSAAGPSHYLGGGPHSLHTLMRLLFPTAPDTWGGMDLIVLVDDFPFVIPYRGGIGGSTGFSFDELELYRTRGFWRRQPFVPPADLLAAIDKLGQEAEYQSLLPELRGQALLLLHPVYRLTDDRTLHRIHVFDDPITGTGESWTEVRAKVSRLGLRWDTGKGCYTFTDGSTLPEEWPAQSWVPEAQALPLCLSIQRTQENGIEVKINWWGKPPPDPIVIVSRRPGRRSQAAREIGWVLEPGKPWSRWLWLDPGRPIEFEISTGPVTRTSPVFTP